MSGAINPLHAHMSNYAVRFLVDVCLDVELTKCVLVQCLNDVQRSVDLTSHTTAVGVYDRL